MLDVVYPRFPDVGDEIPSTVSDYRPSKRRRADRNTTRCLIRPNNTVSGMDLRPKKNKRQQTQFSRSPDLEFFNERRSSRISGVGRLGDAERETVWRRGGESPLRQSVRFGVKAACLLHKAHPRPWKENGKRKERQPPLLISSNKFSFQAKPFCLSGKTKISRWMLKITIRRSIYIIYRLPFCIQKHVSNTYTSPAITPHILIVQVYL